MRLIANGYGTDYDAVTCSNRFRWANLARVRVTDRYKPINIIQQERDKVGVKMLPLLLPNQIKNFFNAPC